MTLLRMAPTALLLTLLALIAPSRGTCQATQQPSVPPAQGTTQTVQTIQTVPNASGTPAGTQPGVVLKSDHPLTAAEQADMQAKLDEVRKLPPANPLRADFEIETPDGKKITLKDLHGKVVLLDYWATWCAPCVEGLPDLDAVYKRYSANPKVEILAVNPLMMDTPETIKSFTSQRHLSVPIAYDHHFGHPDAGTKATAPKVAFSLPVVLLLDRDGKQQWFTTGGVVGDTEHTLEKELIAKIDAQLAHP